MSTSFSSYRTPIGFIRHVVESYHLQLPHRLKKDYAHCGKLSLCAYLVSTCSISALTLLSNFDTFKSLYMRLLFSDVSIWSMTLTNTPTQLRFEIYCHKWHTYVYETHVKSPNIVIMANIFAYFIQWSIQHSDCIPNDNIDIWYFQTLHHNFKHICYLHIQIFTAHTLYSIVSSFAVYTQIPT